jgi:hypothetical protein
VKYLPPFELIRRSIEVSTVHGGLQVTMTYENLVRVLKLLIAGIEVDEVWYLQTYEDIARAIKEGTIQSARQHFVHDGWFEGRLPFPINVDEPWYIQRYPDVGESVRNGVIPSAQVHFEVDGYREGRLPFEL